MLRLPMDPPRYPFRRQPGVLWPEDPRSSSVMLCGLPCISRLSGLSRFPSSIPAIALGQRLFSSSMKNSKSSWTPEPSPKPDLLPGLRSSSTLCPSSPRDLSCPFPMLRPNHDPRRTHSRSAPDHKDLLIRPPDPYQPRPLRSRRAHRARSQAGTEVSP
jgi:hypothetical protein